MNAVHGLSVDKYSPFETGKGHGYAFGREGRKADSGVPASQSPKTSFYGEYISYEKMTVNYTGKDGDSFSFDYEKLQAQRLSSQQQVSGTPESQEDYSKALNELYDRLEQKIIEKLSESLGFDIKNREKAVDTTNGVDAEDGIPGLPSYWNAENTAQRIVDFSVSFFSVASQDAESYYLMMKDAINKGYNEAVGEIGSVSKEVSALSEKTLKLAMEKLDAWAREQGVDVEALAGVETSDAGSV